MNAQARSVFIQLYYDLLNLTHELIGVQRTANVDNFDFDKSAALLRDLKSFFVIGYEPKALINSSHYTYFDVILELFISLLKDERLLQPTVDQDRFRTILRDLSDIFRQFFAHGCGLFLFPYPTEWQHLNHTLDFLRQNFPPNSMELLREFVFPIMFNFTFWSQSYFLGELMPLELIARSRSNVSPPRLSALVLRRVRESLGGSGLQSKLTRLKEEKRLPGKLADDIGFIEAYQVQRYAPELLDILEARVSVGSSHSYSTKAGSMT